MVGTYCKYFKQALQEISSELLEKELIKFSKENNVLNNEKKVIVIIGMTGSYKGRLLLETTELTAKFITETMNFGPLAEKSELYLFMGEFVNMLSGRAITYLNNLNRDSLVRLTPPAVFTGINLQIATPNIMAKDIYYKDNEINLKLNIGFEGV
ncbi:chemotaxis protein CheX [Natronospora cellulosivora (SeqCode)]